MTTNHGSKLGIPRQRFLSDVCEHALSTGRRSPADFIRHFPPLALMQALVSRADLRAKILFATVGTRTPIGERKSPEAAAADLDLAIEVGETDAETIVTLLEPDERVRHLDERALWAFITEGDFWNSTDGIELEIASAHVSFILERAVAEKLITEREIIDALTVEQLARSLPHEQLVQLLASALERGREDRPFREADLLSMVPIPTLAEHVPLPLLWESVVVRRIAEPRGLGASRVETPEREPGSPSRRLRVPPLRRRPDYFDDDSTNDVVRGFLDAE